MMLIGDTFYFSTREVIKMKKEDIDSKMENTEIIDNALMFDDDASHSSSKQLRLLK